jgi:hypothetical protein
MNDLPQDQLNQLLSTHGQQLPEDPQRCEALLRDTFPSYPREVSLLVNALKQGVPQELLSSHNKIPFEVTRSRLTHKLTENLFVQDQAAEWVVDAWSEALGVKQTINRPMTTMQPPDLGSPSGGQGGENPGVSGGFSGGVPVNSSGSIPGSAPTAINPGSNSGNYTNPANYNAPDYGSPSPPVNAPVNYGAQPTTGTPGVWVWFIIYCSFVALICAFYVFVGVIALVSPSTDPDVSREGSMMGGFFLITIFGLLGAMFGSAPFLPKRPWVWIYDLVLICLSFSGCCIVFGIPLLIFWLKPETKAFFNMQSRS